MKHLYRVAVALVFAIFLSAALVGAARAEKLPDVVVEENVRAALTTAEGLDIDNLEIQTADGRVTLRGFVPSLAQKELAARVAAEAAGVGEVENELRVTSITEDF
jgi:hyperosmotically inducible periplasmic protein